MKTITKFSALFTMTLLAVMVTFSSCNKDDEPAPQLPPETSFVINFDEFSNPDDTLGRRDSDSYVNWGHACSKVTAWNTILTVGLAVPVASFLESFNHEAVYHPDENNWTWSYNVSYAGQNFEAELTAYLQADSVVWEMRITGNAFNDFLWYHGKSHTDNSGGYWILMDSPSNPEPLLRIDWQQEDNGSASVKYTNIVPEGPENGGYIFFSITQGDEFDRHYDIFNKGEDNLTEIEWNYADRHGRIKDPAWYEDNNWHCWNTNLEDIDCP